SEEADGGDLWTARPDDGPKRPGARSLRPGGLRGRTASRTRTSTPARVGATGGERSGVRPLLFVLQVFREIASGRCGGPGTPSTPRSDRSGPRTPRTSETPGLDAVEAG